MMDAESVRQIIEQYSNYGWTLRRVLLSSKKPVNTGLFGGIAPEYAEIDALWFSRRSRPDAEAWELRRLSGSPFALVQVISDASSPGEREAILKDTESAMARSANGPTVH